MALLPSGGDALESWPDRASILQATCEAGAPLQIVQLSALTVDRQLPPLGKTQCSAKAPGGELSRCSNQCCGWKPSERLLLRHGHIVSG